MKHPVNDALVAEFAKRLRSGGPLGEVFPYPPSECDFTETQKQWIKEAKEAQKARKKLLKKTKTAEPQPAPKTGDPKSPVPPATKTIAPKPPALVPTPAAKAHSLNKLEKMLYLQQGKCFFCGEKLTLAEANIEHLHPLSKGGTRTEDNEVVCHKTLNETFGNLPLKQKFEFVLKAAGSFRCPKK